MKAEKLGQEPAFPTKLNQVIGQTSYNFTDEMEMSRWDIITIMQR